MNFKSDIWRFYSVNQNDACLALCNNCSAEIARRKRGIPFKVDHLSCYNHTNQLCITDSVLIQKSIEGAIKTAR